MKARLLGSLMLGAIVAAIVVIFADRSPACGPGGVGGKSGGHQSVVSMLFGGFVGVTLFVAIVVFVLATVLAGARRRRAASRRQRQDASSARRPRADAWR